MYNLIEMQNKLKGLSKEQLMQVLKSGSVPQYMVVSELNRRKNMESDQARREATDGANTVTQEVINAVGVPQGGIAQLAGAMNAQTDNTQNTGVMQMAAGGLAKMKTAGSVRTDKEYIAELKRLYPEVYELYKDNYNEKDLADMARAYLEGSASTPDETGLEALEAPRRFDLLKRLTTDPSSITANKMRQKVKDSIEERELQAQQETQRRLRERDKFYIGADPIFSDGGFSEQLKGTVVPVPLAEDPLKFRPPNNMSGPSVATDRSLNMANVSQPELGPMFPLVSSNRPIAEPTNLPVITSPAFTSMLPNISQGDVGVGGKPKENIIRSLLAGENPFETGVPLELQADAATDLNRRAREFYNTDTYTPPEMIYSGDIRDILKREEATPEEIQAASDRLAREAAAGEVAKEQGFYTEQDNAAQSVFDEAIAKQQAMLDTDADAATLETLKTTKEAESGLNAVPLPFTDKSLGELIVDSGEYAVKGAGSLYDYGTKKLGPLVPSITEAVTQVGGDIKDIISEGIQAEKDLGLDINSLYKRLTDDTIYPVDGAIDNQPQDREPLPDVSKKANEAAEAKIDPTQAALNKIIENQQKQAEASNMSLSKYLEGLERDREFTKAMALVEAGAAMMEPSPTFGEGVSKALKRGNKELKEGLNSYNKNKLAVLALDSKIKAAKASASARAGIAGARLQTAALADERDQLQSRLDMIMLPFMGGQPPDAKSSIQIKELQRQIADLNNQIRTASGLATLASVGADSGNIFGSYDLT